MVDRFIGIYVVTFCILALDADEASAYFDMRGCQDCGYSELIFFSCSHLYHILNFCFLPCISITFWDASVHHETSNCQTICSWKIQITNHEFSCFLARVYITFWIARVHHTTARCRTTCSWKIQITNHRSSYFLARIYITFWIARIHHAATPAAKWLVAENYKSQGLDFHPRFLGFKMCWYITTFTPCFSFPLVYTADAPSKWQMF